MLEIVHAALPMDGRIWRVEWFGYVRTNPFSPRELEVGVTFRKLGAGPKRPPMPDTRTVFIGIAFLCNVPLGSLWCDGRVVENHDRVVLDTKIDLSAAKLRADYLSLLLPYNGGADFLFGNHIVPKTELNTRVLQIEDESQKLRVYIPLTEIARSWFLRDSVLSLALTSGHLNSALELLYEPFHSSVNGEVIKLEVRNNIPDSAVPIIGMLASSEHARSCAARMVDQIVAASVRKKEVGIEALIPLDALWSFSAAGGWNDTGDWQRFYIYRLRSVQLPKMKPIEWGRTENETVRINRVEGDAASTMFAGPSELEEIRLIHRTEPSASNVRHINFKAAPLTDIPEITKIKGTESVVDVVFRPREEPSGKSVTVGGTGSGTGSDGVTSIRFVSIDQKGQADENGRQSSPFMSPGLDQMILLGCQLGSSPDLLVRPFGGSSYTIGRGFLYTNLTTELRWALIGERPRQAVCLEIEYGGGCYYLMEVERRFGAEELSACLLWKLAGKRFSALEIDRILYHYAVCRGSWKSIHEPFFQRTLAHKFKDESTFVSRVQRILRKVSRENLPHSS